MAIEYFDENNNYKIDCTNAIWSTNNIHDHYQDRNHAYGEIGFLCDVDWVIETETHMLLVEYKNANIPNASNPGAFNPMSGNKLRNVGEKYFDSLHWLFLSGKDKPKKYVYILEYPAGNTTSRLLVRQKLQKYLPFQLQRSLSTSRKLIDDVLVMDISEWNTDKKFSKYPILPVGAANT